MPTTAQLRLADLEQLARNLRTRFAVANNTVDDLLTAIEHHELTRGDMVVHVSVMLNLHLSELSYLVSAVNQTILTPQQGINR